VSRRRPFSARALPIRAYFILLIGIVLATASAAAWFVQVQTERDSRRQALADARFAAVTAGKEFGQYIAVVRASVENLTANPRIAQTLQHPAGCTLTFAGVGGPDRSHLDIVGPDGKVACSSRVQTKPFRYSDTAWVKRALARPTFAAPTVDRATGGPAAVVTSPIPGRKGFVVGLVDLTSVGHTLATLYSGGHQVEFLVTTADGAVVARSIDPAHWIGRSISTTQLPTSGSTRGQRDLDGTRRLYAKAPVPGTTWRFYAGEDEHAALAAGNNLERRQLEIIVIGFLASLFAAWMIHRRIVKPLRRLRHALRSTSLDTAPSPVPVEGPAELHDLGTDINGLIGSVNHELAERRRAEAKVAASERNYRLLFETSPIPKWVFDTETTMFLAVNEAAVQHYGYSRDEFMAMAIDDIRPAEEVGRLHDHLAAPQDLEEPWSRPTELWRHVRKDGTVLDVEVTAQHQLFEGRPARVVLALDVTERLRAEQSLRRSESRYRELFENATDLIATVDLESRFTAVNAAFTTTLGYSSEELIGRPLSGLVPEESHIQLGTAREDKLEGLGGTVYVHDLIAKDGRRIPVEVASRIIEEDGRPVGIEAICRDLSERRHLESQLRQSQKLEAIGRLAGGIAHDFNNLLTVISGYTEALLEQGDPEAAPDLKEIAAAADRATILTRQLLAFSRRQVLQPRIVNVNEVVENIAPMLRRLIGEDVDLVAALDGEIDTVLADPSQLEQVLVNLAVNARDAMPHGGRLTIETGRVELDAEFVATHPDAVAGKHTMLAVSDTGTGMTAETIAQIFEPFFTTKPLGSGTGLGLSTAYGIVRQSHGSIWVYSEPEHGTTFKVYLPAQPDRQPLRQSPPADSPAPDGNETVLIVEDEAPLRNLVAERLRSRGYLVLCAETAEAALELAEQHEIDLLVTDVVMPLTSGRELAEIICTRSPSTRVLFMSGYADEAVVRNGTLNPGATFLEKPFSSLELARRVRQTLDEQPPGRPTPSAQAQVVARPTTWA
jgi:two-component system cell cycle sensor histidine kinase/response regulator CckA